MALNLMISPGAGKTNLLEHTLGDLSAGVSMAVVEGDQETSYDAERISKVRVPVVQISTGRGCHLEADMAAQGLRQLNLQAGSVVFIGNVGNLVYPALLDLGEAAKVVIFSVTEGEDRPRKYPHMFHGADLVLINKVHLLSHIRFDLDRCLKYLKEIAIMRISFRSRQATGRVCLSGTTGYVAVDSIWKAAIGISWQNLQASGITQRVFIWRVDHG
ncbi:hydrogenase accessory protein HypB [Acidithiobacillus sp. GGI-221]|nr:hydrogenase accessory protein HypB [Acidithiobacillus sp. GGI-221]